MASVLSLSINITALCTTCLHVLISSKYYCGSFVHQAQPARKVARVSELPSLRPLPSRTVPEKPVLDTNANLQKAKENVAQLEQKRDAAETEWLNEKDPEVKAISRDVLLGAQRALEDAQAAVTSILSGNGGQSSNKLPADDATVVELTTMWQSLCKTDIKPHTDVFPHVEVLNEDGELFNFNVLEVQGPLPFVSEPTAESTVVERDFYPFIKKIANENVGNRFRVLLRGPPGIGKSGALGAYLLHAIGQRMSEDREQCPAQQVVLTSPENLCAAYHRDGTVEVWEHLTAEVSRLARRADTVWIMDERQHGSFLAAQGLTFLIASADPKNYDTYWKHSNRLLSIPAWNSDGRLSDQGLPLELEALIRVMLADGTSKVTIREAVDHFRVVGAFPRDVMEDFERAQPQISCVIANASIEDALTITSTRITLETYHIDHRLGTPNINRDTLTRTNDGTFIIASAFVREALLAKQTASDWAQTLKFYKSQAMVSGSRVAVGKLFEELAFHYITQVRGKVTAWRLYRDGSPKPKEVRLCRSKMKVDTTSTFLQDLRKYQPYALKSDNKTEGGIDWLFATRKGDLTALNATLNRNHDIKARHIARRLEHQNPAGTAKLKFVWVMDQQSASRMKWKPMSDTMANKTKETKRNELLGRVEQWVAQVPIDFEKHIRYNQIDRDTSGDEDESDDDDDDDDEEEEEEED